MKKKMIDSHCHLDHEPLLENLDEVLKRSKEVGISKLLTICTTLESFERIKRLIKKDSMIFGTFGIHPHETESNIVTKETITKKINENEKIIGIGETGLDFFYNHSNKKRQIDSFKEHIEASIILKKPIIIHSRNAEHETFEILNLYKNNELKILMHCFTGSLEFSKKLLTLGAFFSASGIITFKNSIELQETFNTIPLDKLLIETDSPFLAPIPMRGKKNEPSFIKYTAEKLSLIKERPIKQIVDLTTKNFNNLFNVL
ncbi:TatD family hydrolase [Pelagibacteraceae bacterium]|nr:TatD family hydrolase [Pelagibacteraceae bacterium]